MNADPPARGGSAPVQSVPVLEWLRSIHPELSQYAAPMQEWWECAAERTPLTTASIVVFCACPLDAPHPARYERDHLEDIADYTRMTKQHRAAFIPAAVALLSQRGITQPTPAGVHPSVQEWLRSILPELESARYAIGFQQWWDYAKSVRGTAYFPDHWTKCDLQDIADNFSYMTESHKTVFLLTAEQQLLRRPFDDTGGDLLILPTQRQPAVPAPPAEAEGTPGVAPTSGGLP